LVWVLACLYVVNAVGGSLAVVLFRLFGIVFGLVILIAEISAFDVQYRRLRGYFEEDWGHEL
jgi:hypothetical protein